VLSSRPETRRTDDLRQRPPVRHAAAVPPALRGAPPGPPHTATARSATDPEMSSIHRSYFTSWFSYLLMLREKVLSAYHKRTERDR